MNKTALALATTALLSCSAMATEKSEEAKRNELIGMGSGAVIGTAIGGPVGGVVGFLFGAMFADDINDEQSLDDALVKLEKREHQLVALNNQLEKERQQAQLQLVSMETQIERVMEEGQASMQFQTASYVIEDHYKPQLKQLADNIMNNPRMVVHLSGYADRRGNSDFNQALSEQRALTVKQFLIDLGVSEKQVFTQSYGESMPVSAQQNYETDFFDRRVVLRVEEGQQSMTAKN